MHKEISAEHLAELLQRDEALVVDVREADEFAKGHIPSAVNLPLSTFDPAALPEPQGRTLVLSCAGGKRSALALDRCVAVKSYVNTHLAGGFVAWQKAGLPLA